MTNAVFLALLILSVFGLLLLRYEYRKTGALILFFCVFAFMAVMPWSTLEFLMKESTRVRAWAYPRMTLMRNAWYAVSFGFALIVGLCVAFLRRTVPGYRKPEWDLPGKASALPRVMRAALEKSGREAGVVVGLTKGNRPVVLGPATRQAHMQVVGPTRCGKSQLLFALAGQDMMRAMPVCFMEAKGDRGDFDQFLKLAAKAGRSDKVRYFNPQDDRSMTFNPIRMVPGQDTTAIANQIARAIGREPTSSGEGQDYYRSVDYTRIVNMAEVFSAAKLQFTLKDCYYYFAFEDARKKAFDLCPDRKAVGIAYRDFDDKTGATALTSAIRPWTTGRLGELLNSYSPQIKLDEIFNESQLAYFAIPIGYLQVSANALGRMLISGLLSVASSRQHAREKLPPASMILDEFAEFATPVFASFIATVGSADLWTVLSHQDMGQLKKVQGMDPAAFSSAVFNNASGAKVCFRTPDPNDAEFWALMLGTYRTFDDTERMRRGFLGDIRTGERSRRLVEQFKIHPNVLKNLMPGTALVFSPGHEDALVRTARVFDVLKAMKLGDLTRVEPVVEEGLNLEEAVKDPGGAVRFNREGVLQA